MNRRSVLGMIGLGAAAGPAVVKQVVESTNIPYNPVTTYASTGDYNKASLAEPWSPVEQLASAKREYELLTSDPSKWIADYVSREMDEYRDGYSSFRYESIDADIRALKSFSETAKMRMHIERKAKRRHQSHTTSMLGRIQELMKQQWSQV